MPVEEAKQKVAELVAKYENLSSSAIKSFNEANTKQGFILPLFSALGWYVNETKEVTMEEAASGGRVDFAFKLNGVAQFYLEAKKLNVDLNNPEHMKQAVTYAYGNGVTWAVLTNFEELRLLNAQKSTPFITLTQDHYVQDFDKLWLLSRESLANGLLNREATQYGALTKLIPIEERLFKQLRVWREELYNQLFHHNEWLKPEQRDEIIEKLFNRLIFIRTCEDRKLEEHQLLSAYRQWQNGGKKTDELLPALQKAFGYYRGYYDSDLFLPHILDDSRVFIYDDTIANILIGLYDIPGGMAAYDFAIIDADMLGRVYEQYLGYVSKAVVAKAKEAQTKLALGFAIDTDYEFLERKQQRKEQGIYYTPKFVTDYIVKETVGRFIKENEHDGYNKILNMKILDPACGSGSFLIRAFDELLNYHASVIGKTASELGQNDRLPILTRNVFGVDLDERAVEIACLNLLLRSLAKRDLLPPLTDNIRQGNSLISGNEEELKGYFGDNWREKEPFNWQEKFEDIMAQGGFDVVIGNPPWVSLTGPRSKAISKEDIPYFKDCFVVASDPIVDTYALFLEKATTLLRAEGLLGFIIPDIVLLKNYPVVRKYILDSYCMKEIIHVGRAFKGVNLDAAIVILQKENDRECRSQNLTKVITNGEAYFHGNQAEDFVPQARFEAAPKHKFNIHLTGNKASLKEKLDRQALRLSEGWECHEGIHSGNIRHKLFVDSSTTPVDHPLIFGRDEIAPYLLDWAGKWVRYDPLIIETSRGEYAGLGREEHFIVEKLVVRRTGDRVIAAYDDKGFFVSNNMFVLLKRKESSFHAYDLKFILALLNSELITAYFRLIQPRVGRLFAELKIEHLSEFPIHRIDFDNPAEKKLHDDLVALVDRMLELNKRLAPIRNMPSTEQEELLRDIKRTDIEIDQKVYQLYGLTEEERQIIEAAVSQS